LAGWAFERVVELIESKDERVALAAAREVLDRAWGKAEAKAEVGVTRRFAEVPEVMSPEDWIRTYCPEGAILPERHSGPRTTPRAIRM